MNKNTHVRLHTFDYTRSTTQPFLTGISTKTLWADGFLRMICSKIAKKPPNTEGYLFR